MDSFLDFVQQVWVGFQHGQLPDFGSWNYILVGIFMLVQGRASALLGGIAAAAGSIQLVPIIAIALLTRIIVDLFWYNIGSSGQIDRVGRRFGGYNRMADQVQGRIQEKPRQFMLMAKLSNGLALPAVIAAGTAHVPYRRWLPASFAGELLWTIPLLLVGYFTTGALSQVEGGLTYLTLGSSGLFAALFILFFVRSRRQKNVPE